MTAEAVRGAFAPPPGRNPGIDALRRGTLAAIDARAFWARRAARILPCLAIRVAVLVAFGAAGLVASLSFDEFTWHWLHGNAMLLPTLASAALAIAAQWRHVAGATLARGPTRSCP